MLNLYITSPIRGQGKTFLTAGIAATMQSLGYSTCVYKPIQTEGKEHRGFMQSPDLTYIKSMDPYINTKFSFLYRANAEPIIAAELENELIDLDLINSEYKKITSASDCVIIDGDCGLMSPICPEKQNIDLIKMLQIPVLLSVKPTEDAVNTTLLTIQAAQEKGIIIRGVVINDVSDDCPKNVITSLPRLIEEFSNIKVVGLVQHIENPSSPEDMISAVLNGIDIESVFDVKIEKLDV
jgi:dethiobiotin synthetase